MKVFITIITIIITNGCPSDGLRHARKDVVLSVEALMSLDRRGLHPSDHMCIASKPE